MNFHHLLLHFNLQQRSELKYYLFPKLHRLIHHYCILYYHYIRTAIVQIGNAPN